MDVDERRRPESEPQIGAIARGAEPLADLDDPAFASAFDRFGSRRVVLLGESTHGTHEFYRARAAITRRLVEAHGFSIVAVEADWPDAAAIDRFVGHRPPAARRTPAFARFPTWMWRNEEVAAFIEDLRRINQSRPPADRVGFYGLDMYSLGESMAAVIDYLEGVDPAAARLARERYACLAPWEQRPERYGRAALTKSYAACERAVVEQCRDLFERRLADAAPDDIAALDAAQNARLVAAAERYYRTLYQGDVASWNLRDGHMAETLAQVLAARGPGAKAVVWAHNSHIGDARQTEMGWSRGELNLGQLCREAYGEEAALIGFGTGAGQVVAAEDWGGPKRVETLRRPRRDSVEALVAAAGVPRALFDFTRSELAEALAETRLERFVGVIYRPASELMSHYAEASLSGQFDAYVWFAQTRGVTPLAGPAEPGQPETWPFGL